MTKLRAVLLGSALLAAVSAAAQTGYQETTGWASDIRPGNSPFIINKTGAKAANSILMIHGLTDSPYFVKALAQFFSDNGYNVVAVLLPGHGTKPEDLLNVRLPQWQAAVKDGLARAQALGNRVSLLGFSTGGALALDVVSRANQDRSVPLGDLFLFSPAIKMQANNESWAMCETAAGLAVKEFVPSYPWTAKYVNEDLSISPYKYRNNAVNSVCQLYFLTQDNYGARSQILQSIGANRMSVFAVESDSDTTVVPGEVARFMQDLPSGVRKEFDEYPKGDAIAHASVPRPETNPHYDEMIAHLKAFIATPPSAGAPPASVTTALPSSVTDRIGSMESSAPGSSPQ